jgi:hypothetical protein
MRLFASIVRSVYEKEETGKVLKRGKERTNDSIRTEFVQDLIWLMPERARLAEMITSEKTLSMKEKLRAVEDLLSLCTRDLGVMYRPKEEPINGKCPIKSCQIPIGR